MKSLKSKQDGFGAVEILLIILLVAVIGFGGYYVWHSRNNKNSSAITNTTSSAPTTQTSSTPNKKVDPNTGYLVVKEWGLRFKVPAGLTDVKYAINGETAAFYAKPAGSSVQYRSDYDKFEDGHFLYATGLLYRSKDITNNDRGFPTDGKKVGNYYYYTAWSFSSLAMGAACVELYGSSSEANCKAGGTAFTLVNGNDGNKKALLKTIQLAQ